MELRPYQKAAKAAVLREWNDGNKKTLLVLPTGCHALGEKVMDADGYPIKVEDVKDGTMLMGADGKPRRVYCIIKGHRSMYKIIPTTGETMTVTNNHMLTLISEEDKQYIKIGDKYESVLPFLRDITVEKYISAGNSYEMLRFSNGRVIEIVPFAVQMCKDSAFIGFTVGYDNRYLMADGTLTHNCGKTIVFSSVIETIVKNPTNRVLVLAHRDELIRQAADKLEKVTGLKSGIEKAQETVQGNTEDYHVVIGSVQSMAGKRLENFPVNYFTHIIIDEAHHAITSTYSTVLAHFPGANVLGVTATPKRADKKSLVKVFDTICYEYSLKDAIRDGYLSPIKAQCIPLQLDISNVSINAGDYAPGELSNAIEPYLEQIATQMEQYCVGRKIVVFTPLIRTSQMFTEILNQHGFRAVEVNGKSPNRAEILKDYENGVYNVLVNALLATEGWDCPPVDCVVVLRPTKSTGLYQQMVGRASRLHPGKEDMLILDFLWLTKQHDLCHPASLVASTDEIAKKMCHLIDESKDPMDLDACEQEAIASVERDREEALAAKLAALRNQRAEFISSLQFFASLGQLQALDEDFIYAWEEEEPSEKQLAAIAKFGLDTSQITTKGLAARILTILHKRVEQGLATIKQIKFLERYGFRHVGEWHFEDASSMITKIANNKWKVPYNIKVATYRPEADRV